MSKGTEVAAPVGFAEPQVNLYAGDLEASLRFYRDVLGFRETFRFPREGAAEHVELTLGPLVLGLATFEALRWHHGIRTDRGPARSELDLRTEDVDGAYAWAVAHGARSLRGPYDFLGYVHAANVADPDGNIVTFYARLPLTAKAEPDKLPAFRGHLYNIYTDHLGESLRFYGELLGFRETFRVPREGVPEHVELELGRLNLGVSTTEALRRNHGLTAGGGPPRGEVVLWTTDVDTAYASLRFNGATSLSAPHDFAGGALRAAWVGDPDGNPVQLVHRRGSG